MEDAYTLRYGSGIHEAEFRRYALRKKVQAQSGSTLQTMTLDEIWAQVQEHAVRQRDWSPFLRELQDEEQSAQQSEAEDRENVPPPQQGASHGPTSFPTPPPFAGGAKAAPAGGCADSPSSFVSPSSFSRQVHAVLAMLPKAPRTPSSPFSSPLGLLYAASKGTAPAPTPVVASPVVATPVLTEAGGGTAAPLGWAVGTTAEPVVGRLVDEVSHNDVDDVSPLADCVSRCERSESLSSPHLGQISADPNWVRITS